MNFIELFQQYFPSFSTALGLTLQLGFSDLCQHHRYYLWYVQRIKKQDTEYYLQDLRRYYPGNSSCRTGIYHVLRSGGSLSAAYGFKLG